MKEKSPHSILLSAILIFTLLCGYGMLQLKENSAHNMIFNLTAEDASYLSLFKENSQYNYKAYSHNPLVTSSANLPQYSVKKQFDNKDNSSEKTDFPVINAAVEAEKVLLNKNVANGPTKVKNNYTYTYNQAEQHKVNTYTYQINSKNTEKLSAMHQTSSSSNQTFTGVEFPSSVHPITNNNTNSFLANNSLTITTDLSGNNSAMLVDGESDPGSPGIPVGDGIWILLSLLGMYGFRKILKESIYSIDL